MIPQEMRLEIVTPNGVALCEMVRYVQIPVENGSLGVLPGHTAMMVAVGVGVLKYQGENKEDYLAVSDGFAEVDNDKIIVLTNTAEDAAHIDLARAEAALNGYPTKEKIPTWHGRRPVYAGRWPVSTLPAAVDLPRRCVETSWNNLARREKEQKTRFAWVFFLLGQ